MSAPAPPTVIGRYRIVRTLGEGGMGSVYLAQDPAIDRLVAIKLMRTGYDADQLRDRFVREARSIGRLHHPNIVTLFDVGEHEGEPFIAMEYVEGETLGHLIRTVPDLAVARKLVIIDELCAGLHFAHRASIIHRDIKPANVMVSTTGTVKILDFGIARGPALGVTQTGTRAGTILGTLNYMSPEQLTGKQVDQRADIFSCGAVFYELLSGRPAFPGDILSGVMHAILVGAPEPLRELCPTLDTDIVSMVNRCLEKEPDARYSDLGALRKDLMAVRRRFDDARQDDATVRIARPDPPQPAARGRTPGADTRAELLRLRKEKIDFQLAAARAAFDRGEYDAVKAACQQALIIDPENSDALDLEERAENTQRVREWLKEAQQELERGAVTAAAILVDRAMALTPQLPEAIRVRDAVAEARRRMEEAQRRERAVEDMLMRGQRHLEAGELDSANMTVDEALALDAANQRAATLKTDIAKAFEAKRRVAEDGRARDAVSKARHRFAAGEYQAAIAALKAHAPDHPLVKDVLAGLEQEHAEIGRRQEQERREAEEAKRREEARRKEEARRQEEEARRQAEARRQEEARQKEEARRQEETRRQEEQRKQEAARLEEARKKEETRRQQEAAARRAEEQRQAEVRQREAERQAKKRADQAAASGASASGSAAGQAATVVIMPPAVEREVFAPPAPSSAGSKRSLMIGIGAAAFVVVAGVVWFATRGTTPPVPPPVPVAVTFDILPWANIEAITRKRDGSAVGPSNVATPVIVPLEPGEYHVRAKNPFFEGTLEFDLTVTPGEFQQVRRALPEMKSEDEARRLVNRIKD